MKTPERRYPRPPARADHQSARPRVESPAPLRIAALATTAVLGALVLVGCIREPTRVDHISVDNPTDYDITVTVSAPNERSVVGLGIARRRGQSTFEQVLDQGDVWLFRFEAQGENGGELRVQREQLEADDWQLDIPESVADRLGEKGAPVPP